MVTPDDLEPEPAPGDDVALICVRVRDMTEGQDYDVQKIVDCSGKCGWPLVVSRTGVSMSERHPRVRFICMQCVMKTGFEKVLGSAPGSIDAVADITGRPREEVADDLRRMMRATEIVAKARRNR